MRRIRRWNSEQNFKNYWFKSIFIAKNCLLSIIIARNCLLSIIIDKKNDGVFNHTLSNQNQKFNFFEVASYFSLHKIITFFDIGNLFLKCITYTGTGKQIDFRVQYCTKCRLLFKKKIGVKIVENSISHKKLSGCTYLPHMGVELGDRKIAISVGWYIDSTIETIDNLGLSIISMVFFFKLLIVFDSFSLSSNLSLFHCI